MANRRPTANYWDDHSPDDAIDERWPYDGPHSPETIINAGFALERLVRYMNNASQYPSRFDQPWQVHDILLGVHGALYGLGQLLDQCVTALDHVGTEETAYQAILDIKVARGLLGVPPDNKPFDKPKGLVAAVNKVVLGINHVEKREVQA